MKTYYLIFMLITCLSASAQQSTQRIAVVFYNQVDRELKKELVANITRTYNCTVTEIDGTRTLPVDAYYKPRNRYRADELLKDLARVRGYDKVIGITSKDISTTKGKIHDWGIMGLANLAGKSCVISTYRIKTPNKALFTDRFIKVALHELGHTMGIPHCIYSRTCFMEAAEGTIKTIDRETRLLCSHCKRIIAQ